MIKFILGFIAVVLMALVAYTFTQSEKKAEHKVVEKVETKVEKIQKLEQPKVKKHISVKEDAMVKVVTSQKSVEMSENVELTDEIGEDLTLESIDNANVSDEEKKLLRGQLALKEVSDLKSNTSITEEEMIKIIEKTLHSVENK